MKKWVRNILKGTSLSTALFIFQACYGMPPGWEPMPCGIVLQLIDGDTQEPIDNAEVKVKTKGQSEWEIAEPTNSTGRTPIFPYSEEAIDLEISAANYKSKDTTIVDVTPREVTIKLFKE